MSDLAAQQAAFVAALLAPTMEQALGAQLGAAGLCALGGLPGSGRPSRELPHPQVAGAPSLQRGLQAYRVNAQALSVRVLASVFPAVQAQLGEEAFEAMAWQFWRQCPPSQGDLGQWGAQLPSFFAQQEAMDVWLLDLARLEWASHQLERAADGRVDQASLMRMTELEPQCLGLRLQAGLIVLQVHPRAWQLWQAQAEPLGHHEAPEEPLSPQAADSPEAGLTVAVLLWRQAWRVQARLLGAAECQFLRAVQAGASVETALAQAGSGFDFSLFLQDALRKGYLLGVQALPAVSAASPSTCGGSAPG